MASKKAKDQAAAMMAMPKVDSVSPNLGAAEGPLQCPKCLGRDKVQMPPAEVPEGTASRLDMGPEFVSEPFCNRCMNWLSVLQKQVWEESPVNLPHVTKRQRELEKLRRESARGGAA